MTVGLARVGFKDFDKGLVVTLKSTLVEFVVKGGGTRKVYAKRILGVATNVSGYNGLVPIYFAYPEDVYQRFRLPCIVVRRTGYTPAFDRQPWYGSRRSRLDTSTAKTAVNPNYPDKYKQGYDSYGRQWGAKPFNIAYDVQLMARRENTGLIMLTDMLSICTPPFFTVGVTDSAGDVREYDAGEVNVSPMLEIADIADRMIAWTISFEVRGEIDLVPEVQETDIITSYPDLDVAKK